jgi:hypothetical protein
MQTLFINQIFSMSRILIKNKLEIRPGGVISVPGCEPTSSLTSTGLLNNIDCEASIIPLEDALALIPGSRVVRTMVPAGQNGTGRFFELPEGPPPDGNYCGCPKDWYKILKENARVRDQSEEETQNDDVCSGFDFSGCVTSQASIRTARDPEMRPNSSSLGGNYVSGIM